MNSLDFVNDLFMSLMSFIFIRKHVLLCLMSLEFVVISLLFLIMYFLMFSYSLYLYIVFMNCFVCEGCFGFSCIGFCNSLSW